ncbi:MAG: phage tail tube protein, partial [Giesbergeria sp.]
VTAITFETPVPTVTTGAMPSFSFQTSRLLNGTTQRSFSLERDHSDLTDRYVMFRGMVPSKLSLDFQSGSLVTGSMDFMGKDQLVPATSTGFSGGATTASKTYSIMNAVNGVGNILENGAALSGTYIKSLTLDIDNALRGRDAIGYLGNVEVASGTLSVTGRMSVYFANKTLYEKFINSTATSLAFSAQDPSGNGYVFSLPKVKYNEGTIVAGNKDSDSMVDMGFTALMDTTSGVNYMIAIDRVGVAAV